MPDQNYHLPNITPFLGAKYHCNILSESRGAATIGATEAAAPVELFKLSTED